MGFIWRDSYSIGNASIDSEHQQLFKLAESFFEADDKHKRTDCAMRLFRYTREHFSHEEQLMRDIGYPEISAHVQQHNHLLNKLNGVAEQVAQDTLQPSELKAFLSAWLLGHIVTFDTKLSVYVRKMDHSQT
jgi:hemerythrin